MTVVYIISYIICVFIIFCTLEFRYRDKCYYYNFLVGIALSLFWPLYLSAYFLVTPFVFLSNIIEKIKRNGKMKNLDLWKMYQNI